MLKVCATALTHQGAVRAANEDTIAVGTWVRSAPMASPEARTARLATSPVVLVADGMGGHAAGEVASRRAAEVLVAKREAAGDPDALENRLHRANAELFAMMQAEPALGGMGTTVAGLAFTPARVTVFNLGDSRVYRVGAGTLEQLSTDDTPGPKDANGRAALFTSPLVTQVLGGLAQPEVITPHLLDLPLEPDARFLLASDGLTDLVPAPEIAAAIDRHDRESVERLFGLAIANGGTDNVSIVLVRLQGEAD